MEQPPGASAKLSVGLNCKKVFQEGIEPEVTSMPSVHANHLAMDDWLGRSNTQLGAAACSVWTAYGLRPSRFDCLPQEGSKLTRKNGTKAYGTALAF